MVCCGVLFASYTQPLSARNWGSVGGWDAFEISDDACGISLEYEGKGATELTIAQNVKGKVLIIATNSDWSPLEDNKYLVGYVIDGKSYIPLYLSNGTKVDYKKGFSSIFNTDIISALAAGSSIDIYLNSNRDDEASKFQLIDELKLAGSAAGLSRMNQCLTNIKKVRAAKKVEDERFAHLPDDPFSNRNLPAQSGFAKPVSHRLSKSFGIRYSAEALAAKLEGTVEVELTIGKSGNVVKCKILESSGHRLLDTNTCDVLNRPRRYRPALDTNGNPIEGTITEKLVWKFPVQELPEAIPEMKVELVE